MSTSISGCCDGIIFFGTIPTIRKNERGQLILIKRYYYRHRTIGVGAKVFLHICRIIQLVYSLIGAFLVAASVYNSLRRRYPVYTDSYEYKRWAVMAVILVTVVMNLTIFFKGWRLLKLVKRPYLEEVMASFD